MTIRLIVLSFLFGLGASAPLAGDTLYIPDDYGSIQEAINGCQEGDVLIAKPGTYTENINFFGKAVQVKSEWGPEFTVIDGSGMGSVVTFGFAEGPDSVIEGFTLTNGRFPFGGGVFCNYSSPSVKNCIIVGNEADNSGAGICAWQYSNPTVVNCLIADNHATGPLAQGGGFSCWGDCAPILTNLTICGNSAVRSGGGLDTYNSSPVVANTIFWDNTSPMGAQIYIDAGEPDIQFCNVQGGFDGYKNIDSDPLFFDAGNFDFHIDTNSPCYNTGYNFAFALPDYDIEGNYRVQNGFTDMGVYETMLESLWSDVSNLSAATGGQVSFTLDATLDHANRMYFLLGSTEGVFPGQRLPGGCLLPLNKDGFFNLITHHYNDPKFVDFRGFLDANGQAFPVLDTETALPPNMIGTRLDFAFCTEYPNNFASSMIYVDITP